MEEEEVNGYEERRERERDGVEGMKKEERKKGWMEGRKEIME